MTTKRLIALLAVVLGGMSCIFLLPKHLGYQPLGVNMDLPATMGRWKAQRESASKKEQEVLAGADFSYATYYLQSGETVHVRVVLAGQDMMSNIHRPERCLAAQGWSVGDGSFQSIQVTPEHSLGATRLHNSAVIDDEHGSRALENITYYWFIGYRRQVATHMGRVLVDLVERTLRGYNQRWAMVLVSAEVTPGRRDAARTEEELREVVAMLSREITLPSVGW